MWRRITIIALTIIFFGVSDTYAFWVWTPQTGKWANPKYAVKDTPGDQFEWAMKFFDEHDYDHARKEFEKVVKHFPRSKEAADAQFFVGESYAKQQYYYHAFREYQKVIEQYPYSKRIEGVLLKQIEIGQRYLSGQKYKSMGVALLPAYMKAGEIFTKVYENSPYGPHAAKSLYLAGKSYIKADMFDEALSSFSKIVKEFPKSEYFEKAQFAIADVNLQMSKRPDYDNKSLDNAIEDFKSYLQDNPDTEFSQEAQDALDMLMGRKAQHLFNLARFYEQRGNFQSARIYYAKIVDEYSGSTYALTAKARLNEIDSLIYEDYIEIVHVPPQKETKAQIKQEVPIKQEAESELSGKSKQMDEEYQKLKNAVKSVKTELKSIEYDVNYDKIAKINLTFDRAFEFAHFNIEEPPSLIIDPVDFVWTDQPRDRYFDKGIVKSIKIVEEYNPEQPMTGISDAYSVDYIVIEFDKEVPCEIVSNDSEVIVKAGDYLKGFIEAKK